MMTVIMLIVIDDEGDNVDDSDDDNVDGDIDGLLVINPTAQTLAGDISGWSPEKVL